MTREQFYEHIYNRLEMQSYEENNYDDMHHDAGYKMIRLDDNKYNNVDLLIGTLTRELLLKLSIGNVSRACLLFSPQVHFFESLSLHFLIGTVITQPRSTSKDENGNENQDEEEEVGGQECGFICICVEITECCCDLLCGG